MLRHISCLSIILVIELCDNNNNNNNNNNNVNYTAQIQTSRKCVTVKQKCFQSLPEGIQGYVCWLQIMWQDIPYVGTINIETVVSVVFTYGQGSELIWATFL